MRSKIVMLASLAIIGCGASATLLAVPCGRVLEPMTQDAILQRIKPLGSVEAEGGMVSSAVPSAPQALGPNAGEDRYKSTCSVCHDQGVAGAPKFRNSADWKPRMAVGMDGMLKIAIQGKGGMPPRGTCMQCSDEELKAAIEYMLPK